MSELVREIVIAAEPETIWPFLTDPVRQVEWMGTEAEMDARPGGVRRVLVGGEHPSVGEFLDVTPYERVVFTFGWDLPGHPIPAGSTRVEILLQPEGDATRVRLVHHDLPDDARADHGRGWEHYLGRLALAATGTDPGPDLRPDREDPS